MALRCTNCGIEIRWQPTVVDEKAYCCIGCSQGGPCTCDYEHLPSPDINAALVQSSAHVSAPPYPGQTAGEPAEEDILEGEFRQV